MKKEMKPSGESRYAKRFAYRRRLEGGKENPMPRPFHFDYYSNKELREYNWKQDLGKLLPHERMENIIKYRKMYAI